MLSHQYQFSHWLITIWWPFRKFMNYGMEDFFEELKFDLVSYSSGPFRGAYAASKGSTSSWWSWPSLHFGYRIIILTRRSPERGKIDLWASQTSTSSSTSYSILASSLSFPRLADFCPHSTWKRCFNQWCSQFRLLLLRDKRIYERASSFWALSRDIASQLLLAL